MLMEERAQALHALSGADWLRRYPEAMVRAMAERGRLCHYDAGEWAHAEGDEAGGLLILTEGTFHSYCQAPGERQVMIGVVGPGGVLGYAGRFTGGPRLVTAVAAERSQALDLSGRELAAITQDHPELPRAISESVFASLRRSLAYVAELLCLPARQRIAARLLSMVQDSHGAVGAEIRISQHLLAESVGLTRKTVNRCLTEMQQQGLVQVAYGTIQVRDPAGLRAVANS